MRKETWIKHMEMTTGLVRPSINKNNKEAWFKAISEHQAVGCKECMDRAKTRKVIAKKRAMDDAMRACGLTKVRGAVSGKTYWE